MMTQTYTHHTNPATKRKHYTEEENSLAREIYSCILELISPVGGIIDLALGTIAFQGPFYDRSVDLSVTRTFRHVPVIRRYEGIGQGATLGFRPSQGAGQFHHNGPSRGDKRASLRQDS